MSKKAGNLAKKYDLLFRPTTLDGYVGNELVKITVKEMFKRGSLPQSILLEGHTGCGKTTISRIIAKTLQCKNRTPEGESCEECSSCLRINEKYIMTGEDVSGIPIYEVDMNARGRKDDIETVIDQMKQPPMSGYKVYILDEVQVMGKQAQSALLKIIEEPKPWLYIILCTTDPDDLLPTIKNRLRSLKITRPTVKELADKLQEICLHENIPHQRRALEMIARFSGRVTRASIIALEELSHHEKITTDLVVQVMSLVKTDTYINFLRVIYEGDAFKTLTFIENLYETEGIEYEDFLKGLADFIIDAVKMRNGVGVDRYTEEEYKAVRKVLKERSMRDLMHLVKVTKSSISLKASPKFALTSLALEVGYPEFFDNGFDAKKVKQDIETEERRGRMAYRENKKIEKNEIRETNNEVLDESDITLMFDGAFIVED